VIKKIISGGQTGADRAALDAAIARDVPCGGWCPRDRRAEDGEIPKCYPLVETASRNYAVRTERNIEDSDATMIVTGGALTGGTALTASLAKRLEKPVLIVDVRYAIPFDSVSDWIESNAVEILNVAGPRESQQPGIHQRVFQFLSKLL
jgi:predicted Rossmann-fold nucleotide-binding protein